MYAIRSYYEAFGRGYRAAAIVLMHGYRHPDHEKRLAALARDAGFTQVSASHETSPLMKFVSRGDTTVVDAYLSVITSYSIHYTKLYEGCHRRRRRYPHRP